MSKTYRALVKPRQWWSDESEWLPGEPQTITIIEDDEPLRATGILNAHGVPIFEINEKDKIGF